MVQFRWIKVSLSVMLLLQFTAAVTGQNQAFTVRVGDDVTLPCGNVMKGGNKTSSAEDDTPTQGGDLWIIIVSVGLAALFIVTVAVVIWKKSKGESVQQMKLFIADPEGGVSYASINFIKKPNSEARVWGDDDDDVTLTYSTVKASSSSAGASADLYATVNKPKTNGAAV
ncbi:hypothetical protein GBF38_006296 [Nibea albiflora]|uniref:Uncharacterized protein n=1 Tax=Nibea albiflora TaxID=240163 RepID=A0ACB7FAG9_NIBAL|nr:hypothetical protein GBF38_006296 [Nibea albiflora]